MPRMCDEISSVALAVWLASDFTSDATTAKPRPASPARAASMVAFSARRLVCSAIALISLTTSPICCAAFDSLPMRASVSCACVTAPSAMRLELAHLAADFLDRGRELFGGARHRLYIGGGFFRRACDRRRQALGRLGGPRQRAGGGLELGRRRRDVADDGTDRALEVVREADQLAAAGVGGNSALFLLLGGVALGLGDRLHLELLDGAGHLADFVLAAETGQHHVELAGSEFAHRLAQRDDRAGDAAADQQRQECAEDGDADRQAEHELLRAADERFGLALNAALVRGRRDLDGLRILGDRVGQGRHVLHQALDLLRVLDDRRKRLAIGPELVGDRGDLLLDRRVVGMQRGQRRLDHLQPAVGAVRRQVVAARHEHIDVGGRGHELRAGFLRAGLQARHVGQRGRVGKVLEPLAEHAAAALQLIRRVAEVVALEIEHLAEDLGELLELLRQRHDRFAPCRILHVARGLVDGVAQVAFRGHRIRRIALVAGDDIIAGRQLVGGHLAVDRPGHPALRHAGPVRREARRHLVIAEIGDGDAGCRQDQHQRHAGHDLGSDREAGQQLDLGEPDEGRHSVVLFSTLLSSARASLRCPGSAQQRSRHPLTTWKGVRPTRARMLKIRPKSIMARK